jgi:hypothetical protein
MPLMRPMIRWAEMLERLGSTAAARCFMMLIVHSEGGTYSTATEQE